MLLNKNKKGQAAIEFLMTYGWMLLVVLIVGALIFSFVDFGSLLPNKISLNNNLFGDSARSLATASDNTVRVVFTYNGQGKKYINLTSSKLETDIGKVCNATKLTNLDQNSNSINLTSTEDVLGFLPSQMGVIAFNCSDAKLTSGDSLNGDLSIYSIDPKTKFSIASKGKIRLQIQD